MAAKKKKKSVRGKTAKKRPSKKRPKITFTGPTFFLDKGNDDLSRARRNKAFGLPASFDFSKPMTREELNAALEKTHGEWDLDATRVRRLDSRGRPIKEKKGRKKKGPSRRLPPGTTRLTTHEGKTRPQLTFGEPHRYAGDTNAIIQEILDARKMPRSKKGVTPLKVKVDFERAGRDLAYNDWLRETQNVRIDTTEISALRNERNRIKRQLLARQRDLGIANDNRTSKKKTKRSDFSAKAQARRATQALIAKKRRPRKKT